ncbi:helix-turn-helix domain-containing protein [Sphingomonas sp. LR61]
MADGASDDGGIEILSKAGAIIDALADTEALTVSALADAVGEPTSSTYRLLQSLTAMGWVDAAPARGTYRLGLACMQIGGVLEDSLDVRGLALPRLRELRSSVGVAALLCYRRGTRAVCVERLEGHDVRSVAMQVGDSLPLHVGGAPAHSWRSWPPANSTPWSTNSWRRPTCRTPSRPGASCRRSSRRPGRAATPGPTRTSRSASPPSAAPSSTTAASSSPRCPSAGSANGSSTASPSSRNW